MATAAPTIEDIVQVYMAIRDARTAKRHAWEKADAELEEDQTKLRAYLLSQLNATGAQSVKTAMGTVYRSEKLKPSAADWGAINRWVVENDGFDIYEKRLKSGFIKEYMEANNGAVPPGVNVHREFEVSVRRPTASGKPSSDEEE